MIGRSAIFASIPASIRGVSEPIWRGYPCFSPLTSLPCHLSQPSTKLKAGVVHGQDLIDLMEHAQQKGYAIPAVNCTSNSIINACMEAAKVGV